ncbi:MAG: SGNH/GDSL hydrolase family protein [Candidatus Omnitrophica bacterium]|nr:SGNH/GDSL hydrolase family protein [Candidatus Omnitrophota bacterium]
MLSILFISLVLFFSRYWIRKKRGWTVRVFLINFLIIEIFCYGYFLKVINGGACFYLIGNQKVLDSLIKLNIIESAYFSEKNQYSLFRVDSDVGYTLGQDKFSAQFPTTNAYGLRAVREYSFIPPDDHLRLALFGDSFVFAQDEVTPNTWGYMLENSFANLEVLNFGVPGYGLGQSYLRYLKDGLKFNPDVVFFNYIQMGSRDQVLADSIIKGRNLKGADLYRALFFLDKDVLKTRRITPMDLFDPDFRRKEIFAPLSLDENKLVWNNPLVKHTNVLLFLKTIFLPRYYKKHMNLSEDRKEIINVQLLENLLAMAEQNDSSVIFFVDQDFQKLPNSIQTILLKYQERVHYVNGQKALKERIEKLGVERKNLLNGSNHYNPQGNQIYTEVVAGILVSRPWGEKNRHFLFDPQHKGFIRKDDQ